MKSMSSEPAMAHAAGSEDGPPAPEPLGMLDMPLAWIHQVMEAVDNPSLSTLFGTCTFMRNLVLELHKVHLSIEIAHPRDRKQSRVDVAALARACMLSPGVELELLSASRDFWDEAGTLMSSAVRVVGHELTVITSVYLNGVALDALAPAWLTSSCPNMTTLTLEACAITMEPHRRTSLHSQLKEVHFDHVTVANGSYAQGVYDPSMMQRMQQQLKGLLGLTSVIISGDMPMGFPRCLASLRTQLTQVQFPDNIPATRVSEFGTWFPCVRSLLLHETHISDHHMLYLLQMPALERLEVVGFQLLHEYTERSCMLANLAVSTLDVESFGRLPLDGLRSVRVLDEAQLTIVPWLFHSVSRQVGQAIKRCGGIQGKCRVVQLGEVGGDAPDDGLLEIIPILSSIEGMDEFVLMGASVVTSEVLAAIGEHVVKPRTNNIQVTFTDCLYSNDGVWPVLLPSLPGVERVTIDFQDLGYEPFTEFDVIEMCVRACQPVTVQTIGDLSEWEAGWEWRVRAAVAEAGHKHVKLWVDDKEVKLWVDRWVDNYEVEGGLAGLPLGVPLGW